MQALSSVFKAVHGTTPNYLSELCRSNAEDAAHYRLCSAAHGDLNVPCSKTVRPTTLVIVRLQLPSQHQIHLEKTTSNIPVI